MCTLSLEAVVLAHAVAEQALEGVERQAQLGVAALLEGQQQLDKVGLEASCELEHGGSRAQEQRAHFAANAEDGVSIVLVGGVFLFLLGCVAKIILTLFSVLEVLVQNLFGIITKRNKTKQKSVRGSSEIV